MSNFSKFITAAIKEDNIGLIKEFPKVLLDKHERRLVTYLQDYERDYGSVPLESVVREEVDGANDLLAIGEITGGIKQLFAEARRQNYDRSVRELLVEAINQDSTDYIGLSIRLTNLHQSLRMDGITSLEDGDLFTIPKSRFRFKYPSLEVMAQSLLNGEISLFLGRPKTKKTYITLDLCLDAFVNQGKRVYITSLEMNSQSLKRRIRAMIGKYNTHVYRTGTQVELIEAKGKFDSAYTLINNKTEGKLIFPKEPTQKVSDVLRDIEQYKPDVVFVDSIYRFHDENGRGIGDDWGKLGNMIGDLKLAAIRHDIQMLLTSQLKRGAGSGELSLDDIAYADSFGQTCDLIIGFTEEKGEGVDVTRMQIIAARESSKESHVFVSFDWDNCSIQEYNPAFKKKFQ